ncbi:MAG: hypothetical protein HKN83_02015 [Gammaproteobacteria bacterium]|nr:hypothetical protein [Gammaproteobacteria bacterium]
MEYYSLIKNALISAIICIGFASNLVLADDATEEMKIAKSEEVYSVPDDHGKGKQGKFYSENNESILEDGRLFLQVNIASYHPDEDRDDDFNEFNPGVGLEYHLDGYYFAGGFFENSIDKFSTYWGVGHERTIGADWFGLGILGGVVTGYDGGFSPRLAAVPYILLKNGRTSLKTYYVPAVGDVDADAIGFALRFDMGGLF